MSAILLNMIHAEAERSYAGPIPTAINYNNWVSHWFKSAERVAADFDCQGLPDTAKAIREIIVEQRNLRGE